MLGSPILRSLPTLEILFQANDHKNKICKTYPSDFSLNGILPFCCADHQSNLKKKYTTAAHSFLIPTAYPIVLRLLFSTVPSSLM